MSADSKNFLRDIGLGPALKPHELPANMPPANVKIFRDEVGMLVDSPRYAAYVHIRNLLVTYGEDIVAEAYDMNILEIRNEET